MIGRLGYSGFIASGGSSGPPGSETLQDVIINGSLLNRNNTISGNDYAYSLTLQNFSNYLVSIGALGFSMGASGGYYLTNDLTELLEAGTSLAVTNSSIDITNIGNDGGNLTVANKVGIGTSTPTEALDVVGNGLFTGNVGIGVSTPNYLLHIRGNNPSLVIENTTVDGIYKFSFLEDNTERMSIIQDNNNLETVFDSPVFDNAYVFKSGGLERLRIQKETGNVGINTSTPTEALDVVGNGLFTGDVEVSTIGSGFILQSPDATRWRIEVSNLGVLTASAV